MTIHARIAAVLSCQDLGLNAMRTADDKAAAILSACPEIERGIAALAALDQAREGWLVEQQAATVGAFVLWHEQDGYTPLATQRVLVIDAPEAES